MRNRGGKIDLRRIAGTRSIAGGIQEVDDGIRRLLRRGFDDMELVVGTIRQGRHPGAHKQHPARVNSFVPNRLNPYEKMGFMAGFALFFLFGWLLFCTGD